METKPAYYANIRISCVMGTPSESVPSSDDVHERAESMVIPLPAIQT